MANKHQLIVEVIGDTSKLTKGLNNAQTQLNQFAGKSKIHSRVLDSTLGNVKRLEVEAAALAKRTADAGAQQSLLQSRLAGTALKATVAGFAVNALGRNMQELGGTAGKVGNAFSALGSGNIVGFVKSLDSIGEVPVDKFASDLVRLGDSSKALAEAAALSAVGLDKQADAARGAAAQIIALNSAFVDNTAIRDSTSPGAIAAEVSGIPSPKAKRRPGITAEQRNRWFDSGISRQLDRNQDIPTLQGQLADLRRIEGLITQRLAVTKDITRKLSLEDQLAFVRRDERGVTTQIAENAALAKQQAAAAKRAAQLRAQQAAATRLAQREARQFRELGLAPDGSDVTPGTANLKKRVASITDRIGGTKLDTPKLHSELARFRKVLSEGLVPKDVRAKIKQMLDDINAELNANAQKGGPLTKTTQLNSDRILEGLGLGRDAERTLRARLSHFNSTGSALAGSGSGSGRVVVDNHLTVVLDGRQVEASVSKQQARVRKVNTVQRNGPLAGWTRGGI